ncbi:hypothetical protein K438DRAFT_1973531 [Mycena galopus ATCC 62051]|nr:hypothetical protein K438DRAFT_1973531 [Mycena galopus ATCC 62051]
MGKSASSVGCYLEVADEMDEEVESPGVGMTKTVYYCLAGRHVRIPVHHCYEEPRETVFRGQLTCGFSWMCSEADESLAFGATRERLASILPIFDSGRLTDHRPFSSSPPSNASCSTLIIPPAAASNACLRPRDVRFAPRLSHHLPGHSAAANVQGNDDMAGSAVLVSFHSFASGIADALGGETSSACGSVWSSSTFVSFRPFPLPSQGGTNPSSHPSFHLAYDMVLGRGVLPTRIPPVGMRAQKAREQALLRRLCG